MEVLAHNKTEVNTVEAEFKVNAEEFEGAVQAAYLQKRKNITLPGFRKGKAPRKMIETHYGENVFYEDAVNGMYQKAVSDTAEELGLDVVEVASLEVTSVSKDDGVAFKASFTVKPEVAVTDYLGLKIKEFVKTVTDEDIAAKLHEMQVKSARIVDVTDRAAENGDTAVFDFAGFCDGVQFEGGTAERFSLELGSGQFIPGFEEQLVGKNIGEDFDVDVTFPEEYQAKELAGKAAVFKCKIHELKAKELTALDDEFAKDVSEFDTLDELKADITAKLEAEIEEEKKRHLDDELANALLEKLEAEIPPVMYEHRINDMVRDWEMRNRQQGITVEDYIKYAGITMEQFREIFREPAEKQVRMRLALEKIADLENIEITDDRLEEEYKALAESYSIDADRVKKVIAAETLRKDLRVDRAHEIVKENAKVTKPRAPRKKKEEASE